MATVEKRRDSYRITVSAGYDVSGKQLRQRMTWTPEPGMTNKQVEKELNKQAVLFEEKVKTGKYIDSNIKFADFAEKWIKDYAEKQLAPTTVASYKRYLKRTNAAIGHIRLDRLRPNHLVEFYNNLAEEGIREDYKYKANIDLDDFLKKKKVSRKTLAKEAHVSEKTVAHACKGNSINPDSARNICKYLDIKLRESFEEQKTGQLSGNTILHYHHLISSILTSAVQWQVIASNPADHVKSPKIERKEAAYLNDEEALHLIELLDSEPVQYRVIITLLLYTGLRRGEACGLEWKDIDFDNKTISIDRASQYIPKEGIITTDTKNYSSVRTITVSQTALKMLKVYRVWQTSERLKVGDKWIDRDRLFTKWNGEPIHPDTITNWFHAFIQKTDLPDIHIHSLRHTNATLSIAHHINIRVVSKMLGHSQTSTTMNISMSTS